MPLIATKAGMLGGRTGEVISNLLRVIHRHFGARDRGTTGFDIVLVCRSDSDYAAVQHARRQSRGGATNTAPPWLEHLATHASEGTLAVLFGAGVSAGIGLPSWSRLLDELILDLGCSDITPRQLARLDPVDAATVLIETAGRTRFNASIRRQLLRKRHALTHGLISNLRPPLAITTNYDQGYELAVKGASGERPRVLPWEAPRPGEPALLKLHGDVRRGQIVLSREDFVLMHAFRRPLAGILQERLMVGHVLTVGTAMSDATLVHAAEDVRALMSQTRLPDALTSSGTVLLTEPDEGRARLLAGTFDVAVASRELPARTPDGERLRHVQEAARRVDVLLDWLGMQASSSLAFMLDGKYSKLVASEDRPVAAALAALGTTLTESGSARDGQLGRRAERFLTELGWESPRRRRHR
jgi:hypothetical protein